MRCSYEELETLLERAFTVVGFSSEDGRYCVQEILDAEWRGKKAYGLELVPHVIAWGAKKTGPPRAVQEGPVHVFIEGGDNPGPVVAELALELALKKVSQSGFAIVGVRNKWPWIVAGYYVRRAAAKGWIAATWSAAVSIVAPYGGVRPVFGTNPFSIGVPCRNGPIVFDSAITAGRPSCLRDAKKRGELLPEGIAVDQEGRLTQDPDSARKGALLPFGEHRGSGLAMMIELLGGAWVGAKTGATHRGSRGFVFALADPNLFGFGNEFPDLAEKLVEEMRASAGPGDEVHIPGRSPVNFKESCEVDERTYEELLRLAGHSPQ